MFVPWRLCLMDVDSFPLTRIISTPKVPQQFYMCVVNKNVKRWRDRQTDWQHIHSQADEQDKDRQAMVPPEMQMSKLLAAILLIRHQSVAAAPLAAVL